MNIFVCFCPLIVSSNQSKYFFFFSFNKYYIQSIRKRRHTKFRCRGITQKKEYMYYIDRRQVGLPVVYTLKLESNTYRQSSRGVATL